MQQHEFHGIAELEEVQHRLARASQHPVYVDFGRSVGENLEYDRRTGDTFKAEVEQIPERFAVWNNREDRMAYMSSERYEMSQHSDVIDYIREAVAQTTGDIKMGVIRDYSERIDGTLVFDGDDAKIDVAELVGDGYIPPDNEVDPHGGAAARDVLGLGMRFGNSFDGTTRVTGSTMGYRFICQNWLVWGEETIGTKNQLHIEELNSDFFEDLIFELFDTKESAEILVVEAEENEIPLEWVPGILEQVGFGPNYRKRICKEVVDYTTPLEGYTTAWRLYNAVTYELDHNTYQKASARVYDRYQGAAEDVLVGDWTAPEEETDIYELVA